MFIGGKKFSSFLLLVLIFNLFILPVFYSEKALAGFWENMKEEQAKLRQENNKKILALELPEGFKDKPIGTRIEKMRTIYRDAVYGNPKTKAAVGGLLLLGLTYAGIRAKASGANQQTNSSTNARAQLNARAQQNGAIAHALDTFNSWGADMSSRSASKSIPAALKIMTTLYGGGGLAIYGIISGIKALYRGYDGGKELLFGREYTDFQETLLRYLSIKHEMPESWRRAVEEKFNLLENGQSNLNELQMFLQHLTHLPVTYKENLVINPDIENKLLGNYPEEVRSHLQSYVFDIAHSDSAIKKNQSVLFLHGLPGTGKSMAGKLMGEVLDIPVATVSLAGLKVKDLEGSATEPGAFLSALIAARNIEGRTFKNMIFIIDDFDRILNAKDAESKSTLAYVLFLLDPEHNHTFKSPYLMGADVMLPDNIIITGNSKISDVALRRRFHNIEFTGFDKDVKLMVIAEQFTLKFMGRFDQKKKPAALPSEDDLKSLLGLVERLIEEDKDPGFRTINLIADELASEAFRNFSIQRKLDIKKLDHKFHDRLKKVNAELDEMKY